MTKSGSLLYCNVLPTAFGIPLHEKQSCVKVKKHVIRVLCLTIFLLVMVLHDATSLVATGHSPFALLF